MPPRLDNRDNLGGHLLGSQGNSAWAWLLAFEKVSALI